MSVMVTGVAMRPAWPTSCCSSSVAPRIPLCISVRFQIVFCEFVICSSAVVTMLETTRRIPVANSSSTSEKPDSEGRLVIAFSELRGLERGDGRLRDDRSADRRLDRRYDRDLLHAG